MDDLIIVISHKPRQSIHTDLFMTYSVMIQLGARDINVRKTCFFFFFFAIDKCLE